MKTILCIMKDYMNQTKRDDYTFDELFAQVEKELGAEWAKQKKDFDETISTKKGETYKLLTIAGYFVRNDNGTFKLKKL